MDGGVGVLLHSSVLNFRSARLFSKYWTTVGLRCWSSPTLRKAADVKHGWRLDCPLHARVTVIRYHLGMQVTFGKPPLDCIQLLKESLLLLWFENRRWYLILPYWNVPHSGPESCSQYLVQNQFAGRVNTQFEYFLTNDPMSKTNSPLMWSSSKVFRKVSQDLLFTFRVRPIMDLLIYLNVM